MCNDMVAMQFHELFTEAKNLTDLNHKQTLGYKELEAAVKLTLPQGSTFRTNCVEAGRSAIDSYSAVERAQ